MPPRLDPWSRIAGRVLLAVALGCGWLLLVAAPTPAGADPARPTDYVSTVLAVHPALPRGALVRVVGGDAFLELHVPRGHTASVPDYTSGPGGRTPLYLRFRADGTVQRNENSTAAVANRSRYGHASGIPHPDAAPRWHTVSHDGTYVWHDHRIHWMLPSPPDHLLPGRVVSLGPGGRWTVPLVVDGHAVRVVGELRLLPGPSGLGWYAVIAGIVIAAVVVGLTSRRRAVPVPYPAVAAAGATVAAGAAAVSFAAWRSLPAQAGSSPIPFAVAVAAAAAALVATGVTGRARLAAVAATAAGLVGWGWLRVAALDHAVLPTTAPFVLDRAATAISLGAGLGIAVLLVWQPPSVLTPPATRSDHDA